jgi:hypothetical protein
MCGIAGYEGPLTCGNFTILAVEVIAERCVAKPRLSPPGLGSFKAGMAAY